MKKLVIAIIWIILFVGLGKFLFTKYVPKYKYICYFDKGTAHKEYTLEHKWTEFKIKKGETIKNIVDDLFKQKLITDKDYFLCYVRKEKLDTRIRAGTFYIPNKITLSDLALRLTKPEDPYVHFVIPEGFKVSNIVSRVTAVFKEVPVSQFNSKEFQALLKKPSMYKDQFEFLKNVNSLEGFLFPAKYDLEKTSTAKEVLNTFLQTFNKRAWPVLKNSSNKIAITPYEALIIASIVEKEATGDMKEKKNVADIIIRRYKNGWYLQTDAVLLYYYQDDSKHSLTQQELQQNHPYNVYKHIGLPPTPICNPGIDSIKAVLNHTPNNYWYYMHDRQGKIHYAITYQQHLNNVNKYLR